jgi:hypothetical protein
MLLQLGEQLWSHEMTGEREGEIIVHLSLKLLDFWIEWPGHSTRFILPYRFFGNIFPLSI